MVNKLSYYQILLVYNFVLYFVFLDKKFKMSSNCFFPRSRTVCEHPYDLLANHSHTLLLGLLGNRGKFDSILHFLQRIIKKFGLFNCAIQHIKTTSSRMTSMQKSMSMFWRILLVNQFSMYVCTAYYSEVNRVFHLTEKNIDNN